VCQDDLQRRIDEMARQRAEEEQKAAAALQRLQLAADQVVRGPFLLDLTFI
jgi:hypothetical protein